MPERNHEVVIDGYVFPDTVTVTLANDEYVNSRDYVSKELYESVCGANAAWQSENARLRKLLSSALIVAGFSGRQYLDTYLNEEEGTTLWQELKGLGIEVDDG